MDLRDVQSRRLAQDTQRKQRLGRARLAALGSLLAAMVITLSVVISNTGGSRSTKHQAAAKHPRATTTSTNAATTAASTTVPILTYYVINSAPPGSTAPADLYTPADQFTAQMTALKSAGWHAVTLDQVQAAWSQGKSLGPGKPIVISFDNGYASQYTNALPVLKRLGWVGVANLEVNGLSSSQGGMTESQIRGLLAAGWELDAEGATHTDLTSVGTSQLQTETVTARQMLHARYGASVNWFSYPLGQYDATVVAAVRTAGFVGATTIVPGWASARGDRYRLPRLQVAAGTSPSTLLSQITAAQNDPPPPDSYSRPGIA
jgi:peptidoglycan/xylan/chitin deacetylase (PgdA/CDA1 family)